MQFLKRLYKSNKPLFLLIWAVLCFLGMDPEQLKAQLFASLPGALSSIQASLSESILLFGLIGPVPYGRTALALFGVGFATNAWLAVSSRSRPLRLLQTRIKITFLTADGSRVKMQRDQVLVASHPEVEAYKLVVAPDSASGLIRTETINGAVHCAAGVKGRSRVSQDHRPGTHRIVIQYLTKTGESRSLPYSRGLSLLPGWLLLLFRGVPYIKNYIVTQSLAYEIDNEYNNPGASYRIFAAQTEQRDITIAIDFAAMTPCPRPEDVVVTRYLRNAVRDDKAESPVGDQPTPCHAIVRIDRLSIGEEIVVSWRVP